MENKEIPLGEVPRRVELAPKPTRYGEITI
jgi:hypothetical protein